jgi:hypothetical protein
VDRQRLANEADLTRRMEQTEFPPHDPLYQKAKVAYDEVCSLMVELHDMNCRSGVGREKRG